MGRYLSRALRGAGKALGKGVEAADGLIDGPVAGGINRVSKGIADHTAVTKAEASNDLISRGDDSGPVIFGNHPAKKDENQPVRITRDDRVYPMDDRETDKIHNRLDPGESVVMSIRQSRVKPGGANINPATIFVTEKRVIIRFPTRMGLGEDIVEHEYGVIRSIQLEKGVMSSSLVFFMAGNTPGTTIQAIPKAKAEAVYRYVRGKIQEAKDRGMKVTFDQPAQPTTPPKEDPLALLQKKYINGEITREEFLTMKEDLGL